VAGKVFLMTSLAGFDFQSLTQQALNLPEPFNMAADYGVSIIRARSIGAWRCILAYRLTPEENDGRHCIFVECLDEQGKRTREPVINWYPNHDEPMKSAPLDGSDDEPAAIIKLRSYDTVSVRINDGTPNIDSDSVGNIHARHGSGVDYGHHSFYLVFQRQGVMMPEQPAVKPPVVSKLTLTTGSSTVPMATLAVEPPVEIMAALESLALRVAELERWRDELEGDGR
jgi:hypothetical protein